MRPAQPLAEQDVIAFAQYFPRSFVTPIWTLIQASIVADGDAAPVRRIPAHPSLARAAHAHVTSMARTEMKLQNEKVAAMPPQMGIFEATMTRLFTRRARIDEIENVGECFRIITLSGDALRNASWTPGDKVEVQLGGWTRRTYTPIEWDEKTGRTRILAFTHATGPGAQWAANVQIGDECILFGPRRSIKLKPSSQPVILIGDETSLGLSAAIASTARNTTSVFDVSSPADALTAADALKLPHCQMGEKQPDATPSPLLQQALIQALAKAPEADVILTGNAKSIQAWLPLLKSQGVGAGRRQAKAYWAPGKTGLD